MIRAIIVEDEGVAGRKLKSMLEKEGVVVIDIIKSNGDLVQFLKGDVVPDLYFMDIHLSDGVIFETLQQYKISTPIIFTTAYDEYAIKAFKQNSVDYLLKPIMPEELRIAIGKYKEVFNVQSSFDLQAIGQLFFQDLKSYRDRIKIKVGDHLRVVKVEEVALFYSQQKITFIKVKEGRSFPIDSSLEKIAQDLDPKQFHRVNRSQIVNIEFIQDIISYSNSRLKIKLNVGESPEVIVARERVKVFKDWLG